MNLIYYLNQIKCIFFNFFNRDIRNYYFLSDSETIQYLIENNKSLIRWGDGETFFFLGGDYYFQRGSKDLQKSLYLILKENNKLNAHFLLAMPKYFLEMSKEDLVGRGMYGTWHDTRCIFLKFCEKRIKYGDAFVFRPESRTTNLEIEQLWLGKDVIIVCSEEQYYEDFKEKYNGQNNYFVKIPKTDAFEVHEQILFDIKKIIEQKCLVGNKLRILVAAGPAAKVIVYKLSIEGFISYDIGQYFVWKFYNRTKLKQG